MYRIEGIERVDYISKKTKKRVLGAVLYISSPLDEKRGNGRKTDRVYVSDKICPNGAALKIGTEVNFLYDRYGGVAKII